MIGTEQQLLHLGAHAGVAFHRQVGLGSAGGQDQRLGAAHAVEHRQAALLVEVDANRQVDLVGPCICVEGVDEREDGVARVGLHMLEHKGTPGGAMTPIIEPS
jgi:hypothetical protein